MIKIGLLHCFTTCNIILVTIWQYYKEMPTRVRFNNAFIESFSICLILDWRESLSRTAYITWSCSLLLLKTNTHIVYSCIMRKWLLNLFILLLILMLSSHCSSWNRSEHSRFAFLEIFSSYFSATIDSSEALQSYDTKPNSRKVEGQLKEGIFGCRQEVRHCNTQVISPWPRITVHSSCSRWSPASNGCRNAVPSVPWHCQWLSTRQLIVIPAKVRVQHVSTRLKQVKSCQMISGTGCYFKTNHVKFIMVGATVLWCYNIFVLNRQCLI